MNKNLITLISHYESLHDGDLKILGLQPKMDPVGIWTEGWGHAILDSKGNFVKGVANKQLAYSLAKVHTKDEADNLLLEDIKPILLTIKRKVTINLNDNQTAALISFIYNTGGSSTLYKLINTKSTNLYKWWTEHYITGQGIPLKGLVYRRKSEALLFTKNELKFFN